MSNELVNAAVTYASRNWRVIALHFLNLYDGVQGCSCRKKTECNAAGKHPVFSKWREIATTDVDKLQAWWRRWPRANIGLLMGGVASLVCVDIDGDEGRESLKRLEAENSKLPKTRSQSTGRAGGGEHFIFHVDPFYVDWIRNRAKVAPGLDFRSEGGLIVAAPSLHLSGNRYQWRDPHYPIAELPEWMFKLALSKREVSYEVSSSGERPPEDRLAALGWPLERRLENARAELALFEPAIQGQNGSAACYRAAILIARGFCIPVEGQHNHVFDLMWSIYNPMCVPAWNQEELLHKIHDAERISFAPWGFRLNFAIMQEQYTTPRKIEMVAPIGSVPPTATGDVQTRLRAHTSLEPAYRSPRPVPPSRAELLARPDYREPQVASQPSPKPTLDEDDEGAAECV